MIQIDPKVWGYLVKPSGEELIARNPFPDKPVCLLCALDSRNHRHFLIPINENEEEYNDLKSKGFVVVTRSLIIQGDILKKYMDIQCIDPAGNSIFDLIGGDIFEKLENNNHEPIEKVKKIIMKWRRFWGNVPQNFLSREEQIGLFAELWFLSVWLIPRYGETSVQRWNGPSGSRHDFEWPDKSVEVKATLNTRGRIHKINGISQLEKPDNGNLYLFSVRLREDATSIYTLPFIIDECSRQLADSPDALDRFESTLILSGYSPVHQDNYSDYHLSVIEQNLFSVCGDFPVIINSSFNNGVPAGVERVEYEINLNTFDHLIVCNDPESLSF